ncbi:MAG: hypothetical protein KBS59_00480, partial [Clostridiales bacterium]|nr:hypothetical protein [Clostridiales bacterium]
VKGDNGKSAYQTAVDGGYTGTEQEFTQALTEVEDKYTKPSGGIPKSDLNAFVQTAVDKADTALQPADLDELEIRISDVEGKIPDQASSINKLADKNFVNSSIGTNTANYISNNGQPFTSVAQLEAYSGTVTNNDYAFVTGTDEAGNTYFDRYKATVSGTTVSWAKEYRLNNSSFTAAQWAAIQSGITGAMVVKLSGIEAHAQVNAIDGGATLPTATEDMLGKFFIVTTPLTDGDVQYNYLYQCRQTANGYEWDRVYTQYVDKKPVAETFSIQSENWVRPGVAPFGFICPRSTSHTIGADTDVELINNNAVNFAKFGIAIISAGNGFVTFGAVNKPDATVNLEVNYYG